MVIFLEKEFVGGGEVLGFSFKQVMFNDKAYVYEVRCGKVVYYEVFFRKTTAVCLDFEKRVYSDVDSKERYPKSNDFGVWAWTVKGLDKAKAKFDSLE